MQKKNPNAFPDQTSRKGSDLIVYFFTISLFIFSFFTLLRAQSGEMSRWYSAKGKKLSFEQVARACAEADVVLFGELHNNSVSHWYQLQLFNSLIRQHPGKVILGMEMLEAHQQLAVDSFLKKQISEEQLIKRHTLWPNHKTDYQPLLEVALGKAIPVIATNVPRKYARIVSKQGKSALDTLPASDKQQICPLPYVVDTSLTCYKNLLEMGHGDMQNGYNFACAQALKDATMAHFILKNLPAEKKFLHLNGAYHSDFFESIGWYLNQARPDLKIVVLTTQESENLTVPASDDLKKANFILVTDPDVPKSY